MAHTGIFATSAQILAKAGFGANSTATAEATINGFCLEAESYINIFTGVNYSDTHSSLNADKKAILQEVESNIVAMYIIQYDVRGYGGLGYAQTMLNVLWDRAEKCLNLLKDNTKVALVSNPN